jgi:hypothetical protein
MEERWIKCLLCGDKGEKLRYKNKNVCYCVCVLRKLKEKKGLIIIMIILSNKKSCFFCIKI